MPGLRFGRTRLATGPELHYAEQGDAHGPAVLFLHGWPDSWFSFSRVLAGLPARYRALAPDLRGFGESSRPESGYGIDELAADAVAFLDAVGVAAGTVVGHSLGSFIARRVAVAYPERVARLVLVDSGVSPVNRVTRDVRTTLRDLGDPVPTAFARAFQASTAYVPLPEEFFDRIVAESVKAPARVWRDVFEGLFAFDDVQDLGRIGAPSLILWGDRDELFPLEDQEQLASAIPGARLTIYPETGHCPNWERPERLASDLDAFMQRT